MPRITSGLLRPTRPGRGAAAGSPMGKLLSVPACAAPTLEP